MHRNGRADFFFPPSPSELISLISNVNPTNTLFQNIEINDRLAYVKYPIFSISLAPLGRNHLGNRVWTKFIFKNLYFGIFIAPSEVVTITIKSINALRRHGNIHHFQRRSLAKYNDECI